MDLKLKGRVAMITGPAKGMGAAITRSFASEGAKLALVGRDVTAIADVDAEAKALGAETIVAAGALVPEGMVVPPGSLVMGMPAKVKRPITDEERASLRRYAENYFGYKETYLAEAGADARN